MFLSDASVSKETQKMVTMEVFVRSFGCSANTADSEVLSGCLAAAGYKLAKSETEAQLVIYNSCAVKGPTENRIIDALKRISPTKKIVVAGCLPLISLERLTKEVHFNAAVGPAVGKNIVDIVQRVLNGETLIDLEGALTSQPQLDLPRKQTNPIISIIPINYGCLGSCAYCCVVRARGHLRSYRIDEIVQRVKQDVATGAKEFWITSQDAASYGRDLKTDLPALLQAVTKIEGDFHLRVGMMTPNMITPFLEEFIEAFHSDKIYKFVHLPVQSGDNEVLARMRRFYTVEDFKNLVAAFRKAFPQITLSTDVICGFPGENLAAFDNTLKLLEELQPDVVNVSKFFARPKTAAWEMSNQAVGKKEVKLRSTQAANVTKQISLRRNQSWIDWTGQILVEEKGKIEGTWVGRNFAYKPIAIRSSEDLLGKTLKVKVKKVFVTHLSAEIEQ